MRKNLAGIGVLICFAFMLLFPKDVFNGASKGLLLWFHTVFPTLFPFLIITNLLMSTNCIRLIARLFGPLLNKIFRVSPNGSFAIIAGFLCGYPMGAKISADLTHTKQISPQEGAYLLSFCAAAQTQCMIQKAGFSIFSYITQKLATTLVTSLLSILYLLCFA